MFSRYELISIKAVIPCTDRHYGHWKMLKYCQEVNIIKFYMCSNTRLKIISHYCVMNSSFERYIRFIISKRIKILRSHFFHLKCMAMTIHNGNVISINVLKTTFLMKEHNKKARCVNISILLWFCLVETFV